jgi:hypothetical protein
MQNTNMGAPTRLRALRSFTNRTPIATGYRVLRISAGAVFTVTWRRAAELIAAKMAVVYRDDDVPAKPRRETPHDAPHGPQDETFETKANTATGEPLVVQNGVPGKRGRGRPSNAERAAWAAAEAAAGGGGSIP